MAESYQVNVIKLATWRLVKERCPETSFELFDAIAHRIAISLPVGSKSSIFAMTQRIVEVLQSGERGC